MRNILKAATLESKFPLLAVESDCIVSKDADITVAFEVELPELFTVTSAEYAAIHAAWCKAVKVLPDYTVVHKQDWFVKEHYRSRTEGEKLGFLSRSYELHFNERPFLNHCCYLYLTKTTKERMRMQSSFSSLCRGFIIPKEVNRDTAARFLDAAGQFARIVNDTGLVRLRRLSGDEVTGTEEQSGLLEKYLCLSLEDTGTLEDIELGDEGGAHRRQTAVGLYALGTDALPGRVGTDSRYERLSTDRSDCRLSFASPVGAAAPMQPHLQPVPFHRRQRGEPATLREDGTQHAVALPLLAEQPNQQGMDRPVPERRAFLRADLGALPLQCHCVDGQPGRSEGHPQRHGQPDCRNGVQTAPRHGTLR